MCPHDNITVLGLLWYGVNDCVILLDFLKWYMSSSSENEMSWPKREE